MFKLVVLCAFLAAVGAEPEPQFIAPVSYSSNYAAPAAVIPPYRSNYFYSSPIVPAPVSYSAPLNYAHLIKKRSAPLAVSTYYNPSAYIAPASYAYSAPIATTYTAAAPLASAYGPGLVYSSNAHFIKKRSASLFPSAYLAPASYIAPSYAAATPLVSTYSHAAPLLSTPLIPSAPISYAPHFIKKRSAPLSFASYVAPAYSHQSRLDIKTSAPVAAYSSYVAPLSYSAPFAYSHLY